RGPRGPAHRERASRARRARREGARELRARSDDPGAWSQHRSSARMTDSIDSTSSDLPRGAFPLRGLRTDASFPAFFRYRALPKERVLLTNLEGNFLVLTSDEFRAFARGEIPSESELYARLRDGNFLRAHYDVKRA